MNMPLEPTWTDIVIRLALTMLASALIGLNRGARGHAAGFRTTISGRFGRLCRHDPDQYSAVTQRQDPGVFVRD